jgi:hypothetical protein
MPAGPDDTGTHRRVQQGQVSAGRPYESATPTGGVRVPGTTQLGSPKGLAGTVWRRVACRHASFAGVRPRAGDPDRRPPEARAMSPRPEPRPCGPAYRDQIDAGPLHRLLSGAFPVEW